MLLSALMRVLNEEAELPGCLTALSTFCDEIIVVESGSSDRTPEIARSYPKVSLLDWTGESISSQVYYTPAGKQMNMALDVAKGEWVFVVDADERPCLRMKHQLRKLLSTVSPLCADIALWGVHLLAENVYSRALVSRIPGRLARRQGLRFKDTPMHVEMVHRVPHAVFLADMTLFHRFWINREAKRKLKGLGALRGFSDISWQAAQWPSDACYLRCTECYLNRAENWDRQE